MRIRKEFALLGVLGALIGTFPAQADDPTVRGRFSLYGTWTGYESDGHGDDDSFELVSRFTLRSKAEHGRGFEFALDMRGAAYPSAERDGRFSVYDAYVGKSFSEGKFHLRLGQMWITELGGLGSVGGVLAEYRKPAPIALGQMRVGVFGGLEPEHYDFDYAPDVEKGGAFVAVDGDQGRQHVLGYVQIRNTGITERSVITLRNFIPVRRSFFLYQVAEYDVQQPAEVGRSGLSYVLGNIRFKPWKVLEVQANYHRGRSIDARSLADDVLAGQAVDPERLQGLLFETIGGRLTLRPVPWFRVWVGVARDTDNRGDSARDRSNLGFSATDIFDTGLDVTATSSHVDRDSGAYDAWYASVGRRLGRQAYLSLSYSSTVSVFHYSGEGFGVIETRPETDRISVSCDLTLGRSLSLLVNGERVEHNTSDELRVLLGLTYRFRF